ncbi:MAG: DUF1080 domain-containing protein [Verrucomicrobiota bacterium]
MKTLTILFSIAVFTQLGQANQIAESQKEWIAKYQKQKNVPPLEEQLLNTDPEPSLEGDFKPLFNGNDLNGWTPRGGHCTFEVHDGVIVGTCVKGSPSTYLSTEREDYKDFVFTCDIKWKVQGNTGVQFRSKRKEGKKGETVYGPQVEMEEPDKNRGWSGGIYGQSCGGYFYPVWLEAHEEARKAIKGDDWNRVTIQAKGTLMQTWINGVPVAKIENDEFLEGFFALQVHSGKEGTVHFRNLKVKELN